VMVSLPLDTIIPPCSKLMIIFGLIPLLDPPKV
jgi:hypothetical protein